MDIIPKNNHIAKVVEKNKDTFVRLYDIVLWPIIQPIISHFEEETQNNLCNEVRILFLSILTQERNQKAIAQTNARTHPGTGKMAGDDITRALPILWRALQ